MPNDCRYCEPLPAELRQLLLADARLQPSELLHVLHDLMHTQLTGSNWCRTPCMPSDTTSHSPCPPLSSLLLSRRASYLCRPADASLKQFLSFASEVDLDELDW